MVHYKMNHDLPSATIMKRNKSTHSLDETRIYQENVIFLENSTEFSIRLFNPLMETVGVKLSFNGKEQSNILVLKPAQDITIDRFLDNKSKMVFETYEYDSSNSQAEKAIQNNGFVKIEFLKEKQQPMYLTRSMSTSNYQSFYSPSSFNCCCTDTTFSQSSFTSTVNGNDIIPKSIKETGRVEKGQDSNQDFKSVNYEFDVVLHTIEFTLKPISEKSIHYNEIKLFCSSCGSKLKPKYKYCPKCGEKIN